MSTLTRPQQAAQAYSKPPGLGGTVAYEIKRVFVQNGHRPGPSVPDYTPKTSKRQAFDLD